MCMDGGKSWNFSFAYLFEHLENSIQLSVFKVLDLLLEIFKLLEMDLFFLLGCEESSFILEDLSVSPLGLEPSLPPFWWV